MDKCRGVNNSTMDFIPYISISIFVCCLIAAFVGFLRNMPKREPVPIPTLSRTTEARYAFEKAEYDVAKAKYALQFLRRTSVADRVIRAAKEDLKKASVVWTDTLKGVFQVKRRARSASPESVELYERFQQN
jgi:hypothetical protein